MQRAACYGTASRENRDHDPFFPGRGETSESAIVKFCFFCKVRKECDEYADRVDAKVGIWGGRRRTRDTHK